MEKEVTIENKNSIWFLLSTIATIGAVTEINV